MLPIIRKHNVNRSMLNNIFNDDFFFPHFANREGYSNGNTPAVNAEETNKAFILDIAAPGLDKKDFKVHIDGDVLTVSSEKESSNSEEKEEILRKEFSYNSFSRSFKIPENTNANKISAVHKNGILSITIPKVKVEEPKALEIKVN